MKSNYIYEKGEKLMAWYYITYSCGHEGREQIYGPTKNRQWIADRKAEGLCPECYEIQRKKEREEANQKAAEDAKQQGYPELRGSKKEVNWANTLRQELIESIQGHIEKWGKNDDSLVLNYMILNKTNASWYIKNRTRFYTDIIEDIRKEMPTEKERLEKLVEEEIKIEATIYPEDATTDAIAKIKIDKNLVSVAFEKNEKFKELVKNLGYKWQGYDRRWEKEICETTGSAEERAAELGNKLLNEGFPVRILDSNVREAAVNGVYEPECSRWIYARTGGDFKGWLSVNWQEWNDDLYKIARTLPGSKWSRPSVVVKPEHFVEVEEFASLYGFKFTKAALKLIDTAKKVKENAQIVVPIQKEEVIEEDGLKAILESEIGVLDDLKD